MKTLLRLRVIPNARRTEVAGEYGEAIKVKVQAPALDGKANEALLSFLAARLGVAQNCIEVSSGAKSRDKTIAITGLSLEAARELLLST